MILDAIVATLLFTTIVFCWRLSKKVSSLNSSRKELQSLIAEFDNTISRAESGITTLKNLSRETDEQLQKHIEKARFLTNDLAFLTHKGHNIADRLDASTTKTTSPKKEIRFKGRTPPQLPTPIPEEKNIHKDLGWKNVAKPSETPTVSTPKPATRKMAPTKKEALEEVLEQIAARKKKSTKSQTSEATIAKGPSITHEV